MKLKGFIKSLIPPILFLKIKWVKKQNSVQELWSGNYSTWAEAQSRCTGYDSDLIIEKCKDSLLKVKNGEGVYERDSVMFNKIQYSLGLLAGLERVALHNHGKLTVLDFGGSLGSSYFQNKEYLNVLDKLRWCIVEQQHFVECGKKYFEDDVLSFYYSIEECLMTNKPDVLLLSGVLQYLEEPYVWLDKLVSMGAPYIIVDRTSMIENDSDILTVQNVPASIYHASYPAWFFNEAKFKQRFTGYKEILSFPSYCDPNIVLNSNYRAYWAGYQFIRQ